jgi:hypothetical protein
MANSTLTIRGVPSGIREKIRDYARRRKLKAADALGELVLYGLDRADSPRTYSLKDIDKFVFKGGDPKGSMRVDEVVYGIARTKRT